MKGETPIVSQQLLASYSNNGTILVIQSRCSTSACESARLTSRDRVKIHPDDDPCWCKSGTTVPFGIAIIIHRSRKIGCKYRDKQRRQDVSEAPEKDESGSTAPLHRGTSDGARLSTPFALAFERQVHDSLDTSVVDDSPLVDESSYRARAHRRCIVLRTAPAKEPEASPGRGHATPGPNSEPWQSIVVVDSGICFSRLGTHLDV